MRTRLTSARTRFTSRILAGWLLETVTDAVFQNASNPGGEARVTFESAANGQQLSWNTGVDYRESFENGNEFFKRAVRHLYQEAGLDLQADLERINAFPRITASPHALEFWKAAGRTVRGNPRIPVFRMHEIGDYQIPSSLVQGSDAQIRANGKEDLFRTAFINADGHCDAALHPCRQVPPEEVQPCMVAGLD